MKADPFAQADADGRNFIFCQSAAGMQGLVGSCDPHADPAGANFTCDVEFSQGLDDPIFQLLHEVSHISPALSNIEQNVNHPLTGPMIGVLPAPLRLKYVKSIRIGKILGIGACACRIKRRVFQKPNRLRGLAG